MRQSIWNKQIPTFAGLVMLIITVLATSFLVRTGVLFPIRASISEQPQEVRISNITDTSFTVSYVTNDATTGSVTYGTTDSFGSVATDIRDTAIPKDHTIHYITVKNLQPTTRYQFAIISGVTTANDKGKPYTVTTGTKISTTPKQNTLGGKIVLPDGATPLETIIYLESDTTQAISSLALPDGSYTLDIGGLRTKMLDAYAPLSADAKFTLTAFGDKQQATATIAAQTKQLPTITLSQKYDFSQADETTSASSSEEPSASQSADFPAFTGNKPVNTNPQILSPKKDEALTDQQPEFAGTAPPNKTVDILIESDAPIKASVRTNTDGSWSFRPKKPLTPGKHTITITTRDEAGILRTIVQSFIVNAQGSQFVEPSVSPSVSPSPSTTQTPTATPTAILTIAPSISINPTASPTAIPTVVLSPTLSPTLIPTVFVSQQPTIPLKPPPNTPTGSADLFVFGGLASIAIIAGAMLFFVL
jgi:hypothetical protein